MSVDPAAMSDLAGSLSKVARGIADAHRQLGELLADADEAIGSGPAGDAYRAAALTVLQAVPATDVTGTEIDPANLLAAAATAVAAESATIARGAGVVVIADHELARYVRTLAHGDNIGPGDGPTDD